MINPVIFHAIEYKRVEIPVDASKLQIQQLLEDDTKNLNDLIKESEYRAQILMECRRSLTA